MTLWPIAGRELLAGARRGSTYRARYVTGALAGLAAIGALLWAKEMPLSSVAPGLFLFYFTGALAAAFCAAAGAFLTLDAISGERRQGTLGLLMLTELRGGDIVLGKLAAAFTSGGTSFLVILPILAVSLCLGGVTSIQFWGLCLALAHLLLFSLCLGLLISATVRWPGVQLTLFLAVMLAPTALLIRPLALGQTPAQWAVLCNPFFPVVAAADQTFGSFPGIPLLAPIRALPIQLRHGLYASLLASGLCLAFTSWLTPRLIRETPVIRRRESKLRRALLERLPIFGHRGGTLSTHPVMWLNVREKAPILAIWALFGAGTVLLWHDPLASLGDAYHGLSYALFLHVTLKWLAAFLAGRFITQERDSGFLETLLTTPIPAGQVLDGKRRALGRYLLLPLGFVWVIHGWVMFRSGAVNLSYRWPVPWIALASAVILWVDLFSLRWIGFWQGLKSRNSYQAFFRTIGFGLCLPWLPFFFGCSLLAFLMGRDLSLPPDLLALWGGVSASVFGAAAGLWAYARLHFSLRQQLAEPHSGWRPRRTVALRVLPLGLLLIAGLAGPAGAAEPARLSAGETLRRGMEHFQKGEIQASIDDFNKVAEMVPARKAELWQLGISLYYAGKYGEGRALFELHQTVNPQDVENAVWHFLCVAKLDGLAKAQAGLIPIAGDTRIPMKEIHQLFAGQSSVAALLQAAQAGQAAPDELRQRQFYAHLYAALYEEAAGRPAESLELIRKAATDFAQEHYMGAVAKVHLQLRQKVPASSPRPDTSKAP